MKPNWQREGGHETQLLLLSSQKLFCLIFKCLTTLFPFGVMFETERSEEEKEEEVRELCGRRTFKQRRVGRASVTVLVFHLLPFPFLPWVFPFSCTFRMTVLSSAHLVSGFWFFIYPTLFTLQKLLISSLFPYLTSPSPFLLFHSLSFSISLP